MVRQIYFLLNQLILSQKQEVDEIHRLGNYKLLLQLFRSIEFNERNLLH